MGRRAVRVSEARGSPCPLSGAPARVGAAELTVIAAGTHTGRARGSRGSPSRTPCWLCGCGPALYGTRASPPGRRRETDPQAGRGPLTRTPLQASPLPPRATARASGTSGLAQPLLRFRQPWAPRGCALVSGRPPPPCPRPAHFDLVRGPVRQVLGRRPPLRTTFTRPCVSVLPRTPSRPLLNSSP